MWERFVKSWGKGRDIRSSSEQWGPEHTIEDVFSCSGKQAWKNLFQRMWMQNFYGSSREDMDKVLEERSTQQAQETPWSRQDWESTRIQYHTYSPCSHSTLANWWWPRQWGMDIVVWTHMTLHIQVPMCNLGTCISMWLLVCVFICSICIVN